MSTQRHERKEALDLPRVQADSSFSVSRADSPARPASVPPGQRARAFKSRSAGVASMIESPRARRRAARGREPLGVPEDIRKVVEPEEPPERRSPCWGVCMSQDGGTWWHPSYRWDWAVVVVVALASAVIYGAVEPFVRDVPGGAENLEIAFPHRESTITSVEVTLMYVGISIGVVAVCQYFVRSWHDTHCIVLACCLSLALSTLIYNILIKTAGHHRPNFLRRLEPEVFDPDTYELRRENWDMHQSWPSGHALNSMSIFFTLTLYIMGKLRALAPYQGQAWKIVVGMVPTVIAWFIGATRTMDYAHDFADVNAGLFFGTFSATLAYFSQYPSLFERRCHRPRMRRLMDHERYAASAGTVLTLDQSVIDYGGDETSAAAAASVAAAARSARTSEADPAPVEVEV